MVVHVEDPKVLGVPKGPFQIVQERPDEISLYRGSFFPGVAAPQKKLGMGPFSGFETKNSWLNAAPWTGGKAVLALMWPEPVLKVSRRHPCGTYLLSRVRVEGLN